MNDALFVGMLCTRVDRTRAPHPCVDVWLCCGSGVRCFVGRMFSLSYDTEHAVASAKLDLISIVCGMEQVVDGHCVKSCCPF